MPPPTGVVNGPLIPIRKSRKTVMVSSHILPELANICDSIGIIQKAKLLISGSMEDVMHRVHKNRVIEVEFRKHAEKAPKYLSEQFPPEKLKVIETGEHLIRIEFDGLDDEIAEVLKFLVKKGFPVLWFREVMTDLEQVFLTVTEEMAAGARAEE